MCSSKVSPHRLFLYSTNLTKEKIFYPLNTRSFRGTSPRPFDVCFKIHNRWCSAFLEYKFDTLREGVCSDQAAVWHKYHCSSQTKLPTP